MEKTYEIRQGTEVLGTVTVSKQGLYYHFSCRCSLTGEVMHRLEVISGDIRTDLGICVPMNGAFGLRKSVPCKKVGEGEPEFRLVPHHERMKGNFVPVYPDEPFAYLSKLKDAFLAVQGHQTGIIIRNQETDGL